MSQSFRIQINGANRDVSELAPPAPLAQLIETLGLKSDRIAVELNGEIAPRTAWADLSVRNGDKLEIVHFVGGGSSHARSKVAGEVFKESLPAVAVI